MADVEVELSIEIDKNKLKNTTDKSMLAVEKRATEAGKKAGNSFGKSFASGLAVAGSAAVAIFAAAKSTQKFIDASARQEEAINKLNTALKLTGKFTEGTSQSFQEYASKLQLVTRYGDELILENAALIQSLGNLSNDSLKQATKAALDLSAALGIDLTSASTLVGKAAAGEVGSFSRYGLVIKKGADNAETFANALLKINDQFGGAAESQLNTFAGAVDQVQNSFGDLFERIGDFLTKSPEFISFLKSTRSVLDGILPSVNQFGALPTTLAELNSEVAILKGQIADQRGIFTQVMGDEVQREQILADTAALVERLKLVKAEILAIQSKPEGEKPEVLSMMEGMEAGWDSLFDKTKATQKGINDSFISMAKTAKTTLGTGIGQAFSAMGQSLANGENAMAAFGRAMLGTLGDIAIQMGTSFILQGLGFSANPIAPGSGAGMVAAGAALATFGGVLKAVSGGGGGAAPASDGGGVMASGGMSGGSDTTTMTGDIEAAEQIESGPRINLTVNGDILDSRESGIRIVDLINEAFDSKGAVINQMSMA